MADDDTGPDQSMTPKMEKFALALVEGDSQSEAYRCAYSAASMSDETVAVEASRLVRDPRIQARVAELRVSLQRALGVSRASLLRDLDEVGELARTSGDAKGLLNVVIAKARLLGFLDYPLKPRSRSEIQADMSFGVGNFGKGE